MTKTKKILVISVLIPTDLFRLPGKMLSLKGNTENFFLTLLWMTELLLTDIGSKVMMDQAVDSEISYNQYKSLLSAIYAYYQYLFFSSYNKHFMTGTMGKK